MSEQKSWGVSWNSQMYHSVLGECICREQMSCDPIEEAKQMVGFTKNDGPQKIDRGGIGIFECATCFEHLWFHLPLSLHIYKKYSPQWPKD